MGVAPDPKVSGVYHPLPAAGTHPVHLAVHVRGDARAFAAVLRETAARADPRLRLDDVVLVSEVDDADLRFYAFWFWAIVLVASIALLLSLAGIYAVMSFTESRRTREIGIRVALGSSRGSIALSVFRRPLLQVSVGVVLGACLTGLLSYAILGDSLWPGGAVLVSGYAALMMGVCLLACIVPARRALQVQPTEALRAE
ncbi:MAG TPA: FtsX-like permease family protein [Thermoanaerobaculia bacterium]|nr:FtsX-like permease family protein [Thermoanaerobaculia bacterium]